MGAADSKQKLGERVIAARKKLADDKKIQAERVKEIESQSPETINVIMDSVAASFQSYSPFLDPTLLIAWQLNPDKCRQIVLDSCQKVLTAPIKKDEYDWFIKYVFPSSIWMFKTKQNRFMFEELIDIVNAMQKHIIDSMDSIYDHLGSHKDWKHLLKISNQTIVSRQDHKKVGLLQEKGIRNVLETKENDSDSSDGLQTFIDANLAVNILTATAKNINEEFQNHVKTVMGHFGDFKPGPIKKVDRCVSKLENDYQDAVYPKSAKLLDLIRCSVTFNTVDQLVAGYKHLIKHISKHSESIELARVKNGFLDKDYKGGYRDIKANVIYHSSINPGMSMICEIQLLLGQYLHEKKRIHKLYSIVRQELYFKMTVQENEQKQNLSTAGTGQLQFKPVLNVSNVYSTLPYDVGKCSVDSDTGLVAVETDNQLSCVDMKNKKVIPIFEEMYGSDAHQMYSHSWIVLDGQKYLSLQIRKNIIAFWKVVRKKDKYIFTKAEELSIKTQFSSYEIFCSQFDKTFKNIFIVLKTANLIALQKRAVKTDSIEVSIEYATDLSADAKGLAVSDNGKWAVIGGGYRKRYFYLINIDRKSSLCVHSKKLKDALSPVFVNGEDNFCILADGYGNIEVWNVKTRRAIKLVQLESKRSILCLASRNNILAVGSGDKKLTLFNTQNWKVFWSTKYQMKPGFVDLTDDSKYLTVAGNGGEKCLVLRIAT